MRKFYIFILCSTIIKYGLASEFCSGPIGADHPVDRGKYWTIDGQKDCEPGRYCSGTGWAECCPETHQSSDIGAEGLDDCYKETPCLQWDTNISCKTFCEPHNNICSDGLIDCDNGITSNTTVHYENGQCYTGYLYCNQFSNDCGTTPEDQVSGKAKWNSTQQKWQTNYDTNNPCKCTTTHPHWATGCTEEITFRGWVSLSDSIEFRSNSNLYRCKQCDTGYYVNHETDMEANIDDDDCETDAICHCTQVPRGKYIESPCTFTYPITNTNQDICPPADCPFGKTSDAGSTGGINSCHYTHDTQFCDAKGCFSFNDTQLDEWGLNN